MNYGPLAIAIDNLVSARIDRFRCRDQDKFRELDRAVRDAGDEVARAQDQFFLAVKEGRLVQDN